MEWCQPSRSLLNVCSKNGHERVGRHHGTSLCGFWTLIFVPIPLCKFLRNGSEYGEVSSNNATTYSLKLHKQNCILSRLLFRRYIFKVVVIEAAAILWIQRVLRKLLVERFILPVFCNEIQGNFIVKCSDCF